LKNENSAGKSQEIVLLGGSGFIGVHVIQDLLVYDEYSLSLLIHRTPPVLPVLARDVRLVKGSFFDEGSLELLIRPDSIVINLAYLKNETKASNIDGLTNVLAVCRRKKIKRFIHVSTAVVSGRAAVLEIDESVVDLPFAEYEKTKLELEHLVLSELAVSNIDSVILRPTAVFGSSGENAVKLLVELTKGSLIKSYMKACLFNTRKFNLVPVSYIVSAIKFFVVKQSLENKDVFIVSADDEIDNNYLSVEQVFRASLGLEKYPIPVVRMPNIILSIFLRIMGRSNIYPSRVYSSKKLKASGWKPPGGFHDALVAFVQSLK
jgi:nucleoside-diphosphate-sugar epimerase